MELEEELHEGLQENTFEWQQKRTGRIVELRARLVVDHEDLEFNKRTLSSIRDEIGRKYPEMSSGIAMDDKGDEDDGDGTTEATEREGSGLFAEDGIPVYGWLLGRLTDEGKICCMMFGQFSKDTEPPKNGWIYIGKNIDRNLVSTKQNASKVLQASAAQNSALLELEQSRTSSRTSTNNESKSKSKSVNININNSGNTTTTTNNNNNNNKSSIANKSGSAHTTMDKTMNMTMSAVTNASSLVLPSIIAEGGQGQGKFEQGLESVIIMSEGGADADDIELTALTALTSIAEQDHVITEFDMLIAKEDKIQVVKQTAFDDSHKANQGDKDKEFTKYAVRGCSIEHLNGRFLDAGKSCNVPKYRNVRGWAVYRVSLMEIPDLGIFADSCYQAVSTKGPSVADSLNKRSDQAYSDIVDRNNFDAPDGSVQFKRRFAEMSRSGQRVINMDQTMQLIRNENLKAEMRSESDRAMMMILQAVMGSKEKENDKDDNDDDNDNNTNTNENNGNIGTSSSDSVVRVSGGKEAFSESKQSPSLTPVKEGSPSVENEDADDAVENEDAVDDDELSLHGSCSIDGDGDISQNRDNDDNNDNDDDDGFGEHSLEDEREGESKRVKSEKSIESMKSKNNTSASGSVTFGAGIKKKKDYSKNSNSKNKNKSKSSQSQSSHKGANSISAALNKISSGVDLDIKVTLNKGIHYQVRMHVC